MYAHTRIHTHTHIYIYIHTHNLYIYMYTYIYIYVRICLFVHLLTDSFICSLISFVYLYMNTYIYVYICPVRLPGLTGANLDRECKEWQENGISLMPMKIIACFGTLVTWAFLKFWATRKLF